MAAEQAQTAIATSQRWLKNWCIIAFLVIKKVI
jgi:hypothetical protein